MRTPHNPYGGVNPLIDKMIGNAYDVVKYVASHLKAIRYVAENMGQIYDAVHGYRFGVEGYADGPLLVLNLPSNFDTYNIQGLYVVAHEGGMVYTPGPDTFNAGIDGTQLLISITNPNLHYALFRASILTPFPSQMVEQ